ncbi:hypothetical protein SNE40_021801 [Patella caerulea]|uniref:DNA-binding protein SATB2 n=1 Tax=Patella caerulea TaxID=87958 RepID=A0AAN8J4D1_PATCE
MDFNAALETFAEAWVVANTPTAVSNPEKQKAKSTDELPTMLLREQIATGSQEVKSASPKKTDTNSTQLANAKSLPIHCVIEQINGVPSFDNTSSLTAVPDNIELDSYAILPNSTLLQDLVRAALLKLGYSSVDAINAKGAIQIKKWKPLCFDSISDNTQATIEDILGELTNVATLRIRLASQSRQTSTDDVKEKLLQLLLTQSQSLLNDSGCPIEKNILASLSKGENLSECLAEGLSDEMRGAFDKWYSEQLNRSNKSLPLDMKSSTSVKKETTKEEVTSPVENDQSDSSPSYRNFLSHKTRIRTSFDPEYEISRLQKWFQENQHPSRDQMIGYMNQLNKLESRKGRRPLDLTNIIYWFKNARAAQRRASKAMDDSFENEENTDSNIGDNIPYLPNKNAVYVIPFPYHRAVNSLDNHIDEPCDLSMNKRSSCKDMEDETTLRRESSEDPQDEVYENGTTDSAIFENEKQPIRHTEKVSGDFMFNGMSKSQNTPNSHSKDLSVVKSEPNLSSEKIDTITNGNTSHTNSKSVSDNDHFDSASKERMRRDMSDDDSDDSDASSDSSDEQKLCIKEEKDEVNDYSSMSYNAVSTANMSPASIAAMSLAQMSQPLHIPQLPPHLAMAYYPMNARYYMQHANSLQQHSPQPPSSHHRESSHKNSDSRKRRTRVFIDPLTEIPQLEKWFEEDTHPSAYMIDKYCEELNRTDYRQKFPRLESKNIQLWFKNHRAKVKRMRLS